MKSVYLSLGRYDTPDERSRYSRELKALAYELRNGREVEYDRLEIARLDTQKLEVESLGVKAVLRCLLRLFLPGLLFLFALIGLVIAPKMR